MRLFVHFARSYPRQSLGVLICLIVAALVEGLGLSALLPLLGIVTGDGAGTASDAEPSRLEAMTRGLLDFFGIEPALGSLLLIFVVAMVTQSALVLVAKRRVGYAVADVITDLRLALLRALTRARWSYYTEQPIGVISTAISSEADRVGHAYLYGATIVSLSVQAILYSAIALAVSWEVTLAAFAAGALTMYAVSRFVGLTRRAGERQTLLMRSLIGRLSDGLQAVKPLKAMAREALVGPLLERDTRKLNRAIQRQVLSKEALRAIQGPMTSIFGATGIYVAVTWWSMPLAELGLLALLFMNTQNKLSKAQRQYQHMTVHESAVWAIHEMIERAETQREESQGHLRPSLERSLRLENVTLTYGDKTVLEGVSAEIPAGQITAIIGPSGAGKTTLADLTTGLLQPDSGRVLLDDVPLDEIELSAWRRQIGYVPQEMFLLNDTIRANVTLGEPLSDADVERALRRAGAWEFVSSLPDCADALVGERGSRLSGGQRQRISIARALVHGSRFLILDEATASLDPETEAAVWESLLKLRGDTTILAISHQPALTQVADRIYRLDGGKLQPIEPGALAKPGPSSGRAATVDLP